MTLTLRKYGERDGEFLYEYVLTNHNGMRVTLMNFGATLEKVEVPSGDHLVDVILSLKKPEDYAAERNLLGSTVGRIIGRLPGHVWHSGKRLLDLPAGEGPNHIHGGLDGLDRQVWTGTYRSEKSQDTVTFTYLDPDGHNQFPGNVLVTVSYTLADDNAVTYSINAVTDQMTLFNPSNHVYFALDGPNTTIEDTTLTMASDYYGPLKAHMPLGWTSVADSPFDFRNGQRLGDVLQKVLDGAGFDHPFLLKNDHAVRLVGASGRAMAMTTTASALVMFTGNHFRGDGQGILGHFKPHAGLTLETQVAPAAGLDWSGVTLMPGRPFNLKTKWAFTF